MSCTHCVHCQAERERCDEEAMLYERGTVLTHSTLGSVTYWRGAPEVSPDTHVVFRDDDENDSYYASAANLTLGLNRRLRVALAAVQEKETTIVLPSPDCVRASLAPVGGEHFTVITVK